MSLDIGIEAIRVALEQPRPGFSAQNMMAPHPRAPTAAEGKVRDGSVLLLLYPHNARMHTVLTQRSAQLRNHQGQISLPGGRSEPGESSEETALRETEGELGL